jgi:hypothetical protein
LLASEISSWPAVEWINNETPLDAKVALLFSWPRAHLQRAWTLGSVEDHIPTRTHLERYGDRALIQLRNSGVTYVLRGDIHFIHRTYPFMSESEFQESFVAPERSLEMRSWCLSTVGLVSGGCCESARASFAGFGLW